MSKEQFDIFYPILFSFVGFLLVFLSVIVFVYLTRKKVLAREMEIKNIQLETQDKVIKAMIETQENERGRIARDLHDDFNAKLATVKNQLEILKVSSSTPDNLPVFDSAINSCNILYDSARRTSHNMMPLALEHVGLYSSLSELCDDFSKSNPDLAVHLEKEVATSKMNSVAKETQIHLYRILQELLSNSNKHSEATEITVCFSSDQNGQLKFSYQDNGKGSKRPIEDFKGGIGIQNIIHRSGLIGGHHHFSVGEGKGFKFTLTSI